MSDFVVTLSPATLGADVLVRVARGRLTGSLVLPTASGPVTVGFVQGRPEQVTPSASGAAPREAVVRAVRAAAQLAAGECRFTATEPTVGQSHSIDTLGEVLVSLVHGLPEATVEASLHARGAASWVASPMFDKLVAAVASVRGPTIARPTGADAPGTATSDLPTRRAWLALGVLGGLASPAAADAPASGGTAGPAAPIKASARTEPSLPAEPRAREVAVEVKRAFEAATGKTFYEVLGVAKNADAEAVRVAYFDAAKRWHSDRFAGLDLGDYRAVAEDLFRLVDEAYKTLSNPEKRDEYDFVLDRKAKGLPTDPSVVLEAEGLFNKARSFVRQAQAPAAEPLLRRALELNPGEAEFYAYHGFALYNAQGKEALVEARQKLHRALELDPKLDVAHEFLGKIHRVEGELSLAVKQFQKALALNPRNREAERELRFVQMKMEKGEGGLLAKFLKR